MSDDTTPAQHGGLGITSFVVALVSVTLLFIVFGFAAYLKISHQATPAVNAFIGMFIFLCWFLDLVAIGFGIAGIFDKSSKRMFSFVGISFAGGSFLISLLLILIGLSKAHSG